MRSNVGRIAASALAVAAVLVATDAARPLAKEKKVKNKSASGYLGVYMQELTEDVRQGLDLEVKNGVLVSGVADDSPASKAGVEEGDVITAFAGEDVASPGDLRDVVSSFEPGSQAKLELVRDGKARTLTVTVGERPRRESFGWISPDVDAPDFGHMRRAFAVFAGPRLGIDAHELKDDELGAYFGAQGGVLVLGVEEESVAAEAGVKPGDVIQTIGDEKIDDIRDLRAAVREYDEGDEFTIGVLRNGKTQSLKAVMDEQEYSLFRGGTPMRHEWRDAPRAPRVRIERESIRDEIEDLKREIRELKEQLEREDS